MKCRAISGAVVVIAKREQRTASVLKKIYGLKRLKKIGSTKSPSLISPVK
jgi:hypothetical protein